MSNASSGEEKPAVRAAQYVRMSTEHQQYSTENQADVIREYAAKHGMSIVKTYADAGKSGLRIDGRESLQKLIQEVTQGTADFDVILAYDVSRWGRFQDADESAYYEYICKRAGIPVEYCAEQFANDGSPVATIVKGVKRAMAGEYSRELSTKVFKGQCRLIELGFRQGGSAGYGLRRMLVDAAGSPKSILGFGEHKSMQTDRVILVPGPPEEVEVTQRIYQMFVEQRCTEREIAETLNREGSLGELGKAWTKGLVHQVLTNEKYIGNNVFNRVSFKLKKKRVINPPDMWVRRDAAFQSIIDAKLFYVARGMILERSRRLSDDELLARLKGLLTASGTLSAMIIDETDSMPSSATYRARFGSLPRAYGLIGYDAERDFEYIEINRQLRQMHPDVVSEVVRMLESRGAKVVPDADMGALRINDLYTVSLVLSRCRKTDSNRLRWEIRLEQSHSPDLTIAVRMDPSNAKALDYYILPHIDLQARRVRLAEDNDAYLETFRFDTLDFFLGMADEIAMEVAA